MKTNPILIKALGLSIAMTAPASVLASLDINFYGSARMQAETVNPDSGVTYQSGESDSYIGMRDAYSRLGFKANWQASNKVEVFGQLEIPFDMANFKVQDPYNDTRDLRVAQVGINTDHGSLAYGQMWLPFYNAISYKVDRFSTYYSGYATLAYFRAYNAVSYYSPDYNGLSFAAGVVMKDDSGRADTFDDNRYQLTATYNNNGTDFSIGIEQVDNAIDEQLLGAALGQQIDQLYVGVKLEQWSAKGSDNSNVANFYADYQLNQYTFKAMIADVDGFGGEILHIGADYQYSKNLKTFIEFYQQESGNAIANRKAGGGGDFADSLTGGGNALAVGFRYDF
ncbi:MAG: porin [Thiomicrospira sp.]|uniref:porin n=1 Tax=Thiomicrospira sp. TaxID=935 RepID=UPI0019FE9627|nr:porin [Thiomicrospira sp.]MBE0493302.1 porin [Thiomicrospira sp.]